MMKNWHRWLLMFALAGLGGAIQAASDADAKPLDYGRHALIAIAPCVVALKLTLEKGDEGGA